jgi:hypothetical protein
MSELQIKHQRARVWDDGVLTWAKGLKGDGACGCTVETIYTNVSEGPIDQASEQVYALRAEKLIDKAE